MLYVCDRRYRCVSTKQPLRVDQEELFEEEEEEEDFSVVE
jgi:hypothetical protein